MSDKDDLFTPDEEFGDLGSDDFFSDDVQETEKAVQDESSDKPGKVKLPSSIPEPAAAESPKQEAKSEAKPEVKSEKPEVKSEKSEAKPEVKSEKPEVKSEKSEAKPEVKSENSSDLSKRATRPLTIVEKEVNKIVRKASMEPGDLPTIEELTRDNRKTVKMKISDIAVFIKEPEDEMLGKLFTKMPNLNVVNLSAEVSLNNARTVAGHILNAGRMYQPIQVAEIEEDGSMQCTSGRHRLVGLAILYGADAEVLVQVEKMDLATARDAVVVANMARKAKAMEQAEHAALAAVGGDVDAGQDELFSSLVKNKRSSTKYCTYSVMERGKPVKLDFKIGERKDGAITTISGVELFWGKAINWHKGVVRKDFDKELKASTEFLNNLVSVFKRNSSFEEKHAMASMTLSAIGSYYKTMKDAGVEIDIDRLASVVVAMGEIGRQKAAETYEAIVKAMK